MKRVLDILTCDLEPKIKVKAGIMYFLVNSSSKLLVRVKV